MTLLGKAVKLFVKTVISELATVDPKYTLELCVPDDHFSNTTVAVSQLIEHTDILDCLWLHLEAPSVFPNAFPSIHSVMPPLIGALSNNFSLKCLSLKICSSFRR